MRRLLVVDDSPLMRRLLGEIFSEAGDFTVAFARDADEALAQLADFAPDVITLDIHMPGMDGLDCLDRIMVERPTPVVMVSTLTEAGADETLEALTLGAVDFVPKPRGPMSLEIEGIADLLVDKVRSAADARILRSTRLRERVRQRAAVVQSRRTGRPARKPSATTATAAPLAAVGRAPGVRLNQARLSNIEAVLVGVSTGGPPALDVLLEALPPNFPWPVVIAQHMPASFTGPLARRLDRGCALKVVEVTGAVPLDPGFVYIGRGDADIIFTRRMRKPHLLAAPIEAGRLWHPSADRLVESARTLFEPAALIGVLMTGMGHDGAAAMAALRRDGGHVLAQDEASSVVWGMPGALVEAGGADLVLPLDRLAVQLIEWSQA